MRKGKILRVHGIHGIKIIINTERGTMVIGSTFIVFFVLMLMLVGYVLAGGILPSTFSRDTNKEVNKQGYVPKPRPPQLAQSELQMHTFLGITITPKPTPKPKPCPSPLANLTEIKELSVLIRPLEPKELWH